MLSIVNPSRRSTSLLFACLHAVCARREVLNISRLPKNQIHSLITPPDFTGIIPPSSNIPNIPKLAKTYGDQVCRDSRGLILHAALVESLRRGECTCGRFAAASPREGNPMVF